MLGSSKNPSQTGRILARNRTQSVNPARPIGFSPIYASNIRKIQIKTKCIFCPRKPLFEGSSSKKSQTQRQQKELNFWIKYLLGLGAWLLTFKATLKGRIHLTALFQWEWGSKILHCAQSYLKYFKCIFQDNKLLRSRLYQSGLEYSSDAYQFMANCQ